MALAIIFDSVGAGEWLVLLAVLLVVMGPKRLPSTARTIGSYYAKFRRAAESFKRQLMDMDYEMEREAEKARREAEAAMTIPDDPPEFDDEAGGAEYGTDDPSAEYGTDDPGAEYGMDEPGAAYPGHDEEPEGGEEAADAAGAADKAEVEDGDKPSKES